MQTLKTNKQPLTPHYNYRLATRRRLDELRRPNLGHWLPLSAMYSLLYWVWLPLCLSTDVITEKWNLTVSLNLNSHVVFVLNLACILVAISIPYKYFM